MFPKAEQLDNWVIQNARDVVLNGVSLRISPFELQIPYKLFMGTPKDIEDARHLYKMFKDDLDTSMFKDFLIKLDKQGRFSEYLA